MAYKDYYKILGLERTATADDIKKAFHNLVKKYHPDRCAKTPVNEKKYSDIVEAYKILGNLDNRLQYSIILNKDLINKKLLHKKIKINDYEPRFREKRIKRIKVEL
ncbi:MAG: DnaJ domain-containing protein [FCB group bacterium]|jgi:curved DNA-binding protein CbpA